VINGERKVKSKKKREKKSKVIRDMSEEGRVRNEE
jgi:hypothetical protein